MRVAVISLKRTPERWSAFLQRNKNALTDCEILRIDGIDGIEILNSNIKSRLVSPSASQEWSAGAIGAGLSHILCWRLCCNSMSPLVVLEDDVILADTWQIDLKKLLDRGANMLLLGWNLDSMLRAEFSKGEEMISLFEPAYPNQSALHTIVNSGGTRVRKKLRYTFGLPGYWVRPAMARLLLNKIDKLETLSLKLGRGFPEITTHGIDALLNLHYHDIGAEVVMPPLALALNDPVTSLTRTEPDKFGPNNH